MKCLLRLCFAVLLLVAAPARAQYIEIRLSYKAILDPATAQRAQNFTDAQIDQSVGRMNEILERNLAPFRFVRVDPVWNIGQLNDTTGPSRWYHTDFAGRSDGQVLKDQMEAAAKNDARYLWRNDAINIYLNSGVCGRVCGNPADLDNIIIVGGCSAADGEHQLHELGHYFGQIDTQGVNCRACGPNAGQCNLPGDDTIAETLPDLPCWDQDQIALHSFGVTYAGLTGFDRASVDRTFNNFMSYHANRDVFTWTQMVKWNESLSFSRRHVTTGRTWYTVTPSLANLCIFQTGAYSCSFIFVIYWPIGGPIVSLGAAVNAANPAGGDTILLDSWEFLEPITITKPVTLRAVNGPAKIK